MQFIGSASTPFWKFAEHQWDYLGDNGQGSTSENVDRDLFGWGTSGYNHGATCYQPWSTNRTSYRYFAYGNDSYNLFNQTGKADWGYNAISNGGNQEHTGWRTLTTQEWDYLVTSRTTSSGIRWALGTVNDVNGIIILPDEWTAIVYALNDPNGGSYSSNIISADDWTNILEPNGAVFLPAAGYRDGTTLYHLNNSGGYWSSSIYKPYNFYSTQAKYLGFASGGVMSTSISYSDRYFGYSVRLVRNAE